MKISGPRVLPPLAAALVCALPATARAGNDDGVLLGNQAAMTGGAVTADVSDGSALVYNPAGLARITTDRADITAQALGVRITLVPSFITTPDAGPKGESTVEILTIPSGISYARPLGKKVHVGFGVFSPSASDSVLRSSTDTARPGGSGTLQLAVAETDSTYDFTGGVGWEVTPSLRVGASLAVGYDSTFATTQVLLRTTTADDDVVESFSTTDSYKFFSLQLRAGLQWDATRRLSVGVSVQSPGVAVAGYAHETTSSVVASASQPPEFGADDTDQFDALFEMSRPFRLRGGLAYRLDRGHFAVEGDGIAPVSSTALGVDRGPTWNLRVGGTYDATRDVHLGLGLFTDRSGERQDPIHYYGVTLGLGLDTHLDLAKTEHAHEIKFASFFALRYAVGLGSVGGLVFDPASPDVFRTVQSDIVVHEIFLHLGSSIDL